MLFIYPNYAINCIEPLNVVEFINYIVKYSIISKNEVHMPQSDALLISFDKLNLGFISKLDVNLNTIARSYQMYFFIHSGTCCKYNVTSIG